MQWKNLLPSLLAALCLLCSCSVKTDRTECPCILGIEISGGRESVADVSVWGAMDVRGEEAHMAGDTAFLEILVPREPLTFAAWSGIHGCTVDGTRVIIPPGIQMDELYACCSTVDASGESASVQATLAKQYAFVHVNVLNVRPDEYPFYFRIRGDVCGIDLSTMAPVNGDFSVTTHPVLGLYHRFCIPRQNDSSLLLDFLSEDDADGTDPQGEILLGEYLDEIGYDWTAPDLDDIYLDIDRVQAGISITIKDWETVLCEEMY